MDYVFAITEGRIREYFGYNPLNVKPCDQLSLLHDKIVEELTYYKESSERIEREGELAIRPFIEACREAEQLKSGDLEAVIY